MEMPQGISTVSRNRCVIAPMHPAITKHAVTRRRTGRPPWNSRMNVLKKNEAGSM